MTLLVCQPNFQALLMNVVIGTASDSQILSHIRSFMKIAFLAILKAQNSGNQLNGILKLCSSKIVGPAKLKVFCKLSLQHEYHPCKNRKMAQKCRVITENSDI